MVGVGGQRTRKKQEDGYDALRLRRGVGSTLPRDDHNDDTTLSGDGCCKDGIIEPFSATLNCLLLQCRCLLLYLKINLKNAHQSGIKALALG